MNTAQTFTTKQKNSSSLLKSGLFIVTTGVFLSIASVVLAQTTRNPFVSSQTITQNTRPFETPQNTENGTGTTGQNDATTPTTTTNPAEKIALTAIPPRLGDDGSLKALPGEKLQIELRVRNISQAPITTTTSVRDFVIDQDGETPIEIADNISNRWSLASWITLAPSEQTIAANATAVITALIEIPEDALPGGHYAMILHEPQSQADQEAVNVGGSQTGVNQRVGTLVYVTVDGPINEEAYVRNFSFPKFMEYGPVPFSFTVENSSDVHITPQISIDIYNMFNQKVDSIPVEKKNVFPLMNRSFEGQWDEIWGFGRYRAQLTMSYGSTGSLVVANTHFWLLPVTILIAALSILLILMLATFAIKRHLSHKRKLDEQKIANLEAEIERMQSKTE